MKFVLVCLLGFLAVALANENAMRDLFLHFQRKYKKSYSSQGEFLTRYQNFKNNMKQAEENQKKNPKARFGVTQFSDLSTEEFSKFYLMPNFKNTLPATLPPVKTVFPKVAGQAPDPTNYDWATTQYVTAVRNQGQCGSCWAFSATETIESYAALAGNTQAQLLSVEQIVDCDTAGQDQGCNGGFPSGAYSYVQSAGGIETESSYPYVAEGGQSGTCSFNQQSVAATVSGSSSISGETGIYSQLSTAGPVSVCVDASSWSSYTGGVLTTCTNNVDHCVMATGYANYNSQNAYWIVRNSWGTSWGEDGFIWIQIGSDLCSIGDYATIVTAAY
jgi:C1A family cysteine protease